MEEHGLVHREITAEVPVRVDYSATEMGRSLDPILLALCDWGRRHARELDRVDQIPGCPASSAKTVPMVRGAPERAQLLTELRRRAR